MQIDVKRICAWKITRMRYARVRNNPFYFKDENILPYNLRLSLF